MHTSIPFITTTTTLVLVCSLFYIITSVVKIRNYYLHHMYRNGVQIEPYLKDCLIVNNYKLLPVSSLMKSTFFRETYHELILRTNSSLFMMDVFIWVTQRHVRQSLKRR